MSTLDDATWQQLIDAALDAQKAAHAPYSKFNVGAAFWGSDGNIYRGCNVENASFSATVCAERTALGTAVTQGVRTFDGLVVVTPADHTIAPCGICRQVLSEFCDELEILLLDGNGNRELVRLSELLPHRFVGDDI